MVNIEMNTNSRRLRRRRRHRGCLHSVVVCLFILFYCILFVRSLLHIYPFNSNQSRENVIHFHYIDMIMRRSLMS